MNDDCHVFVCVRDAYVGHAVLQIRLSVVVVVEVHLLLKDLVQECPYSEFLLSVTLVSEEGDLLHLVGRNRTELQQFLLGLRHLPYGDFCFVV